MIFEVFGHLTKINVSSMFANACQEKKLYFLSSFNNFFIISDQKSPKQ